MGKAIEALQRIKKTTIGLLARLGLLTLGLLWGQVPNKSKEVKAPT